MSTRRVTLLALSTLAAAGLAPISPAHAATGNTIYVGNNGANVCSDTGPGSATDPFCTFPTAMNAAGPGDTIAVYDLYNTEMDVTKSGTPGSPITIKAVADSRGRLSSIAYSTHAAVVNNQHDVVIEGFSTEATSSGTNVGTDAFVISGTSTRVTVTENRTGTIIQPTPALTVSADPKTPGGVLADPTASSPDVGPNGNSGSFISVYSINWGDGTAPFDENAPLDFVVPHTYTKSGTYSVTLTVETGTRQTASITRKITVTVPPPVTTPPPPTGTPTGPTPPGGTPGQATVTRLGGTTRYGTALAVSAAQWNVGAADGVVIARGDAAPDALAGVPLAAHVHGPLLLTDPRWLDGPTVAEIERVLGGDKTKSVTILGGTSAVSPTVQEQLDLLGYHVRRIGGSDRFDTALRIANEGLGTTANVVVATGTDFADALAAGPLAAAQHAAVVLSDGPVLNPATAAFVAAHSHITAVGGAAVTAVAKAAPGKAATDLWGGDRYATAVKVAEAMAAGHAPAAAGLASGTVFPDALTGGAYAANAGIPLLLTDPKKLPPNVSGLFALWKQQLAAVEIFGGPVAVSAGVQASVVTTVGGHNG